MANLKKYSVCIIFCVCVCFAEIIYIIVITTNYLESITRELGSSGGNFLVRQSSDYVQAVDKFLSSGTSFCSETSKSFLSYEKIYRNWHKIRVHKYLHMSSKYIS